MIRLYLLRHGQTSCNARADVIGGRSSEIPLTALGMEQAAAAGNVIRGCGLHFDRIFCSTAVRARQTLAGLGLCLDAEGANAVTYSACLEELSQGDWEGRPRAEIYTPEMVGRLEHENPFFCPPNGESQHDVEMRMTHFVDREILGRYEHGNFLIVGHGVAFKCFLRGVLGSDAKMTHKLGMDNLAITRLTYSTGGGWTLDWMNRPLLHKNNEVHQKNDAPHFYMAQLPVTALGRRCRLAGWLSWPWRRRVSCARRQQLPRGRC